jgi:hypothetical protein
MDLDAVLEAYNEQVRCSTREASPGYTVERDAHVVRLVREDGSWAGVTWSELDEDSADAAIAAQIERFSAASEGWEWKYYSYDQPPDLPERLIAAGMEAEPVETLLVAEIAALALEPSLPEGVELAPVTSAPELKALLQMQDDVFGGGSPGMEQAMLAGIAHQPPTTAALVASVDGALVAGGRVEFELGSEFAGLWGGCTVPAWRSRGIFRALVAHGSGLAAARGFRYVHADAAPTSRPILEALGFTPLALTTPYKRSGSG